MRTTASLCNFFFVVPLALAAGGAQQVTTRDLKSVVEKAAAAKEKDWRLEKSEARESGQAGGVAKLLLRWKPSEGRQVLSPTDKRREHPWPFVTVEIFLDETPEKAAANLQWIVENTQTGPKGVIKDLGDEAYVWTGTSPHGDSSVKLRKGRIQISVSGPSLDVTTRFAQLVVEEVEDQLKKAGEVP